MPTIHEDLGAVLDAVQIESPERYVFRGEARDLREFPKPADGSPILPTLLEGDLYGGLYTRPGPAPIAPTDPLAQRDLVAALSAANRGRGTWEPHWRIGEVDEDGRVAVTKDEITFWVEPSGLRLRDGKLVPGEWCRVRVAKELRGLFPGFYMAIGDPDEDDRRDDEEPLVRLYWHLTSAAAVTYMAEATTHLNAAGVPFRTKVVNDPSAYHRADAGVLYFGRRHYGRIRVEIARVYEAVRGGLRPDVPLFTRRLAPGLGLAEDPRNGMSFGQHRCHLVVQALWGAFERGEVSREARAEALASAFSEAGLDPLRPYLEPHAPDVYDFEPADPAATRAGRRGRAPRPPIPHGRARGRKVRRP
jgi:hypothetical protein